MRHPALAAVSLASLLVAPAGASSPTAPEPGSPVPPALAIVLAGLSQSGGCLVEDAAFHSSQGGCLDVAAGVVWSRNSFAAGMPGDGWSQAGDYCAGLVEGGYTDWFLPNRAQTHAMLANGGFTHLDFEVPGVEDALYWTSERNGRDAWAVELRTAIDWSILQRSLMPCLCIRLATAGSPPAAPSGLSAVLVGVDEVSLAWIDASADEEQFHVDRSLDGVAWQTVSSLPANSTSFGQGGLALGQSYHYRVWASNAAGASGFSNVALVMTAAGDAVAFAENLEYGTQSGGYAATWTANGVYQVLTEAHSGGPPSQRRSHLRHQWQLNAALGSTLWVKAYRNDTGEGDHFVLSCSTTGSTWTALGVITKTADDGLYDTFALPPGISGTVMIRVEDADRTPGRSQLDALFVDHLFLRAE